MSDKTPTDDELRATLPGEEWRPIVGYEGKYRVSNQGRVYSLIRGRFMAGYMASSGYVEFKLSGGIKLRLHAIMARAFLPNPAGFPVVRHLDDNKYNNVLSNLAWGTRGENTADMVRNGNHRNKYIPKRYVKPPTDSDLLSAYDTASAGQLGDIRGVRAVRSLITEHAIEKGIAVAVPTREELADVIAMSQGARNVSSRKDCLLIADAVLERLAAVVTE